MLEGPTIVILKELTTQFKAKKVLAIAGNSQTDKERVIGKTVLDFRSWVSIYLYALKALLLKFIFCFLALTVSMKNAKRNLGSV